MPNKNSAIKALRQSAKRQVRNLRVKRTLRLTLKETRKAILDKSDKIQDVMKATVKVIDMAAQKKVIHKNKASRLKSRLMKQAQAISKK